MSRVADAYQKRRGTALPATSRPDEQDERPRDAGPWTTSEAPWDFTTPAPLPTEQASVARPREITAVRRRSLQDPTFVSHGELAQLLQRICQSGTPERRLRSVLFSALGPTADTAKLCAAVADALASQTTRSVCLVDANLRTPSLHASFGLDNSLGLSDVLLDVADLHTSLTSLASNLSLLPSGSRCADALPCLTPEQIRPHLLDLLASFDYVFMDTSPVGMHADAIVLGPLVDGVLLVVEANRTRREAAKRATENLQATNATILGAVLTNRSFPIPDRIYRML